MKDSTRGTLIKVLTIFGFCVIIVLLLWLIIAAISRAPGAFNSLANIADSINLREEISALDVTLEKSVVNSGEPFSVTWTDVRREGMYRVGYECTEGMLLLFRDPQGTFRPLRCDTPLPLPHDVHELALVASSTQDRFADVTLNVQFAESESTPPLMGSAKLTIVNAAIPVGNATATATSTPESEDATPQTPREPAPTQPATPVVPPQPITRFVYPESDPNGHTDLAVTITGTGVLQNGLFIPTANFSTYGQNAVQFHIKNIGTKTSREWSFDADLPSGNDDYHSVRYAGLKPQEYMIFTLGFTAARRDPARITISADVSGDTNAANDTAHRTISTH